jgi:hypothetical protein
MTNQEAIDLINLTLHQNYIVPELQDALSVAIKAMEKQIPKRVIRQKWTITKCPCCGGNLGDYLEDGYTEEWNHLKVCDCGQQLDWSYQEEDDND